MFPYPEPDYTLLIPTFNRPVELGMLLRYLTHHEARFRIIVLDASNPSDQRRNATMLAQIPLAAEHRGFRPGAPLAETVSTTLSDVETPYCSLIPDDDLLLPGGLAPALNHLRRHSEFAAAQGYNVAFLPYQNGIRLISIAEWCPTIGDERPLARLYRYARRYQPINWAVYRTAALKRSFAPTVGIDVDNLMMWELTQAFLAVREGKIARLPMLYRLRREDKSVVPRRQLHIFHQFAAQPEKLLHDLIRCRALLIETFASGPDRDLGWAEVAHVIDLIFGHFFWRHFDGGTADFLIQRSLDLLPSNVLAEGEASMSEREMPPPDPDSAADTLTIGGDPRRIWVEPGMLKAPPSPEILVTAQDVQQLIADLAAYH
jgi:glycosyltransferase domain-containing protein